MRSNGNDEPFPSPFLTARLKLKENITRESEIFVHEILVRYNDDDDDDEKEKELEKKGRFPPPFQRLQVW